MLQLDANIVSVSLPVIARSLNASFAGIEWVITAYMLSFASLLLPAGALADRFGRKPLMIIGLSVFTFTSFLCGAAPSLAVLIAARRCKVQAQHSSSVQHSPRSPTPFKGTRALEPFPSGDRWSGSESLPVRWSADSSPRASDGNGPSMSTSPLVSD